MTVAGKQMVEIAKALSRDCRIILMDEPSATLTKKELNALFDIIRDLKKRGIAVIYISHRMEEDRQTAIAACLRGIGHNTRRNRMDRRK